MSRRLPSPSTSPPAPSTTGRPDRNARNDEQQAEYGEHESGGAGAGGTGESSYEDAEHQRGGGSPDAMGSAVVGSIVLAHVASPSEWMGQIDRLLSAYARVGVGSAGVVEIAASELTPQLFEAVLRWELQDAHGDQVYRFDAAYTLAEIDGALGVTGLVHNEHPQLQATLARQHARE